MGKIKLRAMNFGYVMIVDVTIMYINSQMKLQVSLKVMEHSIIIGPNNLKLAEYIRGGVVLRKFNSYLLT